MGLPPAKSTVTNAMRLLATSEPEEFRRDIANKIQPILSRLSSIELVRCALLNPVGNLLNRVWDI
jgi:nuclear pore complex protein Nup205